MKRLLESTDGGAVADKGRELLRGLAPMSESDEYMSRVRRALGEPATRASWIRRTPVLLAATLVLVGASAAGAVGSGHFRRWIKLSGAPAVTVSLRATVPNAIAPATEATPSVATPSVMPSVATPSVIPDSPMPFAEAQPEERSHGAESSSVPPSVPRGAHARSSTSDVALIHDAAKALRHDGDPERAARLLDAVGTTGGPLAEEALALRIEAALAKKDPKAKDLAKDYLARYPQGRYRALALQAVRGSDG